MEISDRSHLITSESPHDSPPHNSTRTHADPGHQHRDQLYYRHTPGRMQEDHAFSNHQAPSHTHSTDIRFTSLTCPGGGVEITGDESVVANQSDLENLTTGGSGKHTEHPSCHLDHQYCNTQTPELRNMEEGGGHHDDDESVNHASVPRNSADVTFKPFTCPGGDAEIPDQSLGRNESEVQTSETEHCEECSELPSRHFNHLYCNPQTPELRSDDEDGGGGDDVGGGGGSVIPSSISNSASDVTFKSFTCPGGEVEVSEESVVTARSLVSDTSLFAGVPEAQYFQSQTWDEHTELPSCHFDHPYCNGGAECSHVQVEGPVTTSLSTLNDSAEAERRGGVPFLSSGAEVGIGNTERTLDTSALTQGLRLGGEWAECSAHTEQSACTWGRVIIGGEDERVYWDAVENDPVTGFRSGPHLSDMAGRVEALENIQAGVIVSESSTEAQRVNPVQEQEREQDRSAGSEEPVLTDNNTPLQCNAEVFPDENGQISHSYPSVSGIPKNSETQNMQEHIIQNDEGAPVWTHAHPEVLRSDSLGVEAHLKMWSHLVLSEPSTPKHSALGHLWLPESPMPPPQLHSTILAAPPTPEPYSTPTPASASEPELQKEKLVKDLSAVGQGPLQDQLRRMGELLIAASGKFSAPTAVTPVQQHSACVWTTPTQQQERSTNTSAIMEERKDLDVSDACTSTDSLLWR